MVLVLVTTIFNLVPVESSSELPGPWELDPNTHLNTEMAVQNLRQALCKGYLEVGKIQQNVKFLKR